MLEIASYPLVAMAVMISALIFIHELGHFLVGRFFGIGVESFSIGFGPTLLSFTHKHTRFKISLLPLGGYVKFAGVLAGENVAEVFKGQELYRAPTYAQAATMAAGPLANLLLAVVIYGGMGIVGVEHAPSVIGKVQEDSPAQKAGLMLGDRIVQIGERRISTWRQMQEIVAAAPEKSLTFRIERDGEPKEFFVVPRRVTVENKSRGQIGVGYGFPSSVVSLTLGASPARRAGIQTGDNITALGFKGDSYAIRHWFDLERVLRIARDVGAKKLDFTVERPMPASDTKQTLTMPLDIAKHIKNRDLPRQLGLLVSELTVGDPLASSLHKGDRIASFEGKEIEDVYGLIQYLREHKLANARLGVVRGGEKIVVPVELEAVEVQKPEGRDIAYRLPIVMMGQFVSPQAYVEQYAWSGAILYGLRETLKQSQMIVTVVAGLFTGDVPLKSLGGPILIAKVAGDSAKLGWQAFLASMALISINLGILNLFPIPLFDGGRLVQIFIESVTRRRMSQAALENYYRIGFVMLLALIVLATYNDLSRFWTSIIRGLEGWLR